MGCNTSQELKTKDGVVIVNGETSEEHQQRMDECKVAAAAAFASGIVGGNGGGAPPNGNNNNDTNSNHTFDAEHTIATNDLSTNEFVALNNATNHAKTNLTTTTTKNQTSSSPPAVTTITTATTIANKVEPTHTATPPAVTSVQKTTTTTTAVKKQNVAAAPTSQTAHTNGNEKIIMQNGTVVMAHDGAAEIMELLDMEMGEDEEKAATKIQAVFRGHQVRNDMKKCETNSSNSCGPSKNGAAAAAEAEPTKEELEAEFDPNDKDLCDAALKIQSAFRGHMTRKNITKDDDVDIQEITKKVAEELDIDLTDPELNKAATKIQASFRGHKSRKDGNE